MNERRIEVLQQAPGTWHPALIAVKCFPDNLLKQNLPEPGNDILIGLILLKTKIPFGSDLTEREMKVWKEQIMMLFT